MTLISRLRISPNLSPEDRSSHRLLCHDLRGAECHGNIIWFFLLKYLRPSFFYENRLILNSSKLTVGEKNQSCNQLLEVVVNEKMLSLRVKGRLP